jgi:hypothetical protein
MKKWVFWGKSISDEAKEDLYVQFMANFMSAILGAGLIGAYHIIFHIY